MPECGQPGDKSLCYTLRSRANGSNSNRNFAKNMSKEKRDEDFAKMDVFEKWFHSTILTGKHSNPLIIMPLECVVPRYRDHPPT